MTSIVDKPAATASASSVRIPPGGYDVAIIGGGIVGLATAHALLADGVCR